MGSAGLLQAAALLHSLLHLIACLQNTPRLSDVVAHLGQLLWEHPLGSARVGPCCGQPWWSATAAGPLRPEAKYRACGVPELGHRS
jgi:hypothetical protein